MKQNLKILSISIVLFTLSLVLKLWKISIPTDNGEPIFDEKHYAPQAWQIITNGTWTEDNPGYGVVVHPPVGKWLIGFGEMIFGYTPLGWRFSAAIFGSLITIIIFLIVKNLTNKLFYGTLAGIISLFDSVLFVASRTAILDIFLTFFILLALLFSIKDIQSLSRRYNIKNDQFVPNYYIWLSTISLSIGLGIKWSAAYFLLGFVFLYIGSRFFYRYKNFNIQPFFNTIKKDTLKATLYFIFIPIILYLFLNSAWFLNDYSVYRHYAELYPDKVPGWKFLPDPLRSFLYYQKENLNFHSNLTNQNGHHHSWESKPWTWPMSLRPILYYYDYNNTGNPATSTIASMYIIGTPIMWWLSLPVMFWGILQTFIKRNFAWMIVIFNYSLGLLPWFINMDRQMYFFYATILAPFLVVGITLAIKDFLESNILKNLKYRTLIVSIYLALIIVNFIWIYPIITGTPISVEHWRQEIWLPSWS